MQCIHCIGSILGIQNIGKAALVIVHEYAFCFCRVVVVCDAVVVSTVSVVVVVVVVFRWVR